MRTYVFVDRCLVLNQLRLSDKIEFVMYELDSFYEKQNNNLCVKVLYIASMRERECRILSFLFLTVLYVNHCGAFHLKNKCYRSNTIKRIKRSKAILHSLQWTSHFFLWVWCILFGFLLLIESDVSTDNKEPFEIQINNHRVYMTFDMSSMKEMISYLWCWIKRSC